uniref:Uncharacterized protein n=1 Tax=Myotis myotis TaxID=51298 RepID=A0A7J7XIW2_MYOMY|nr:hypothetical protein mMyoMyo1_011787 [Myotis myotis]
MGRLPPESCSSLSPDSCSLPRLPCAARGAIRPCWARASGGVCTEACTGAHTHTHTHTHTHRHTHTPSLSWIDLEDSLAGHRELKGEGQPWAAVASVYSRGPELALLQGRKGGKMRWWPPRGTSDTANTYT